MDNQEIIKAIENNKVTWIEQAEFQRQQHEVCGTPSLWMGIVEFKGKEYEVIYQFYKEDIVKNGVEILAEDFPWDSEHIYDIVEIG